MFCFEYISLNAEFKLHIATNCQFYFGKKFLLLLFISCTCYLRLGLLQPHIEYGPLILEYKKYSEGHKTWEKKKTPKHSGKVPYM
jgi:hypothetical protein